MADLEPARPVGASPPSPGATPPLDVVPFVREEDAGGVQVLHLMVEGVHCGACVRKIERALERDVERKRALEMVTELKRRYGTLTPRERQVMAGVVAGRLNKQICYALQSAERTVKTHRARVMEKMEVASVAELVRRAEELTAAGVMLEPTPPGL